MKVKVPIVPNLRENEPKRWLYAYIIARRYSQEENTGGKINHANFVKWLRKHGWKTPARIWDSLCDSQFGNHNKENANVYLKSMKSVALYLEGISIPFPNSSYNRYIWVSELELKDGMKLTAFKKWLTIQIACRPQVRMPAIPRKNGAGSMPAPSPGRSYALISTESGVSKRTAIRHLAAIKKVKQFEKLRFSRNLYIGALPGKYLNPTHGLVLVRIQNSYVNDSKNLWKIPLHPKDDGPSFRKLTKARVKHFIDDIKKPGNFGCGYRAEGGWLSERLIPASPATIYQFRTIIKSSNMDVW